MTVSGGNHCRGSHAGGDRDARRVPADRHDPRLSGPVRTPDWDAAHAVHRRAITPLVAAIYAVLAAASALSVVEGPSGPSTLVALAGIALSLATTALVAAPLHNRLSRNRDAGLVLRLRMADLVRTLGALAALSAAVVAAL